MQSDTKKKLLRVFGYLLLFFSSFVLFLYWSFPYNRLVQRILVRAQQRAKFKLTMKTLQPHYLSGVQVTGINLQKQVKKGTAEVQVKEVTARLSLLPLLLLRQTVDFSILAARGSITGNLSHRSGTVNTNVRIKGLRLSDLGPPPSALNRRSKDDPPRPLLAMLFAPVDGTLNLQAELEFLLPGAKPKAQPKPKPKPRARKRRRRNTRRRTRRRTRRTYRRRRGLDVRQIKGTVQVNASGLAIGPGYFPTAQLGELPVPLVRLGNLQLDLRIEKGKVTVLRGYAIGTDGELHIKGYLQLSSYLPGSFFRGQIRFKIAEAFKQNLNTPELGLLKGGINMLGPGRGGFHTYKVYLPFRGRPRFTKK